MGLNKSAFLWLHVVLILVVNIAIMLVLLFIKSPKINKFIQPLFISLFVLTSIYYSNAPSEGTIFYFAFFIVLFSSITEFGNSSEGRDLSEQENDTIDNNEENHAEAIETNSNENQAEDDNGQAETADGTKQSFSEKLNDINICTFFFILLVWVINIQNATFHFHSLRYGDYLNGYPGESRYFDLKKFEYRFHVNPVFYRLFKFAVDQFIYGMFVLNDNPPKWVYLFYMIPVAVLYPLSSFIAYYVADLGYRYYLVKYFNQYGSIFEALKLCISFKLLRQFIQGTSSEGELNNKIINVALLAVSFLLLVFIYGIVTMGIKESY